MRFLQDKKKHSLAQIFIEILEMKFKKLIRSL